MQHIMQVAFEFDDDKAREIVEGSVENEMNKIVEKIVLDKLAPLNRPSYWNNWGKKEDRDFSKLENRIDDTVREFLTENKEKVLDMAASKIAESLKRTKMWKEKYSEVM